MQDLKSTEIRVSPQIGLDCVEQGDPQAPAVLFLHGYSDSLRSYTPLLADLPPTYRVIAVSQRGHGDSGKPDAGYGIGDFVGDLPALMDRCGIASAAVVGHSMGSMVAARLALDHPDRVSALVLIGALATLKGNAAIDEPFQDAIAAMTDPVPADFVREFQESTLARPVPPAFLDAIVAESCKVPARVWQQALRGMLDHDLGPDLHRISAPTLILWGDQDGICDHAGQTRMAATIPGARLTVFPDAGHAPHWEDPKGVASAVSDFLGAARRST